MTGLGGGVRKGQVGKKFQESSFVSSPVLSRKFSYSISDVHNVYPRDLERENVLGLAWVRRQGDQVLRPPSSCRQATWTVRPPTKALQHRTWSGQEVRAGRPGSLSITARGLGQGKGRIVTMPSWSLPSDWPELQQPGALRSNKRGGALV